MRGEKMRTEINVTDDDLPENGSEMKGTNENRIGDCHLKWGGILKMFSSKWKNKRKTKKKTNQTRDNMKCEVRKWS